jgi:DUF971 family protein
MPESSRTQFASADPEHISISKSKGIKIDWKDGLRSDYDLRYLRHHCPCAVCTGAHGTPPQAPPVEPPPPQPFQMYQPALKMVSVEPIGAYAIRILWSDGHGSGIYSFEHLRKISPQSSHEL